MDEWWYAADGQRAGPVTLAQIEHPVRLRALSRESHIWRDGMPSWVTAREIPEIAGFFGRSEPPPLPPSIPKVVQLATVQTIEPANAHVYPDINSLERTVAPPSSALASPNMSEPPTTDRYPHRATWYRYFARHIDTVILGFPTVFLGGTLIALAGAGASIQDSRSATIVGLAMLCVLFPLVEAGVVTVFGNTPGKALFGLKVRTQEGQSLSFGQALKRSDSVTVIGLGFYVPIVTIFTGAAQCRQIREEGAASYDANVFRVDEASLGKIRYAFALTIWTVTFLISMMLNQL